MFFVRLHLPVRHMPEDIFNTVPVLVWNVRCIVVNLSKVKLHSSFYLNLGCCWFWVATMSSTARDTMASVKELGALANSGLWIVLNHFFWKGCCPPPLPPPLCILTIVSSSICIHIYIYISETIWVTSLFVGCCLATKVFVGKLPATRGVLVIIV